MKKNDQSGGHKKLIAPTIPSEFIFDALQAAIYLGVDVDALIEDAGLNSLELEVKGNRVSVIDYATLVELVIRQLQDGLLGFLDSEIPVRTFSVFATQLIACRNVREVFVQANRFWGLFTQQFKFEIQEQKKEQGGQAIFILHLEETQAYSYRFVYQSFMAVALRMIQWFTGDASQPNKILFSFEEEPCDKYLQYIFDCPIDFGATKNTLYFDANILEQGCSTNLEQVQLMLKDSTYMMLVSKRKTPYTRRVRKELVMHRDLGWPSIDEVAGRMQLSKNLLWRKLKKENTNFIQIRDELKRDLALSLMPKETLSISDIAEECGFSDVSAFNKAFTKWTRQAPSHYRKLLKQGQAGFA